MSFEKIRNAATAFRLAIEGSDRSELSEGFSRFPWGSCGDASLLLAAYLRDEGLGDFELIAARGTNGDHAWLQQGEVVIDITADQFTGFDFAVYVGNDEWHRQFGEIRTSEPADYHRYDAATASILHWDYMRLKGRTLAHATHYGMGL